MSSSSPSAPDVGAICRDLLGSPALSVERIGAGRNSRVFRVALSDTTVVVKFYRHDAGDTRDRLATEFGALRFLWDNGERAVPQPIADDRGRYCAIYEYIDGEAPDRAGVGAGDVDALVDFLARLQTLRAKPMSATMGPASEASFSLAAVASHVAARAARLKSSGAADPRLRRWFDDAFDPLVREISEWYGPAAAQAQQAVDAELDRSRRTLSPSDFGFHNAIRRQDDSLAFVDFEYFGWDDPAKTIVEFLLHPGMTLSETLKRRFADRFLGAFSFVPELAERARIVYPMFGLKWCLILLNDFLPDRATTASDDVRAVQLQKATALVDRIGREYRNNPLLA
jgi:Ser/Thr protein kinase RdoA (MazF antagonist)